MRLENINIWVHSLVSTIDGLKDTIERYVEYAIASFSGTDDDAETEGSRLAVATGEISYPSETLDLAEDPADETFFSLISEASIFETTDRRGSRALPAAVRFAEISHDVRKDDSTRVVSELHLGRVVELDPTQVAQQPSVPNEQPIQIAQQVIILPSSIVRFSNVQDTLPDGVNSVVTMSFVASAGQMVDTSRSATTIILASPVFNGVAIVHRGDATDVSGHQPLSADVVARQQASAVAQSVVPVAATVTPTARQGDAQGGRMIGQQVAQTLPQQTGDRSVSQIPPGLHVVRGSSQQPMVGTPQIVPVGIHTASVNLPAEVGLYTFVGAPANPDAHGSFFSGGGHISVSEYRLLATARVSEGQSNGQGGGGGNDHQDGEGNRDENQAGDEQVLA